MTPPPDLQHLIDAVRQDAGTPDPVAQLAVAAATAAELEETTDALLGHFVDRCRADGRSWSEISVALGVSKQAVHKRFSTAAADQIIAAIPAPTLERFTARARAVLAAARRAATSADQASVSSADILIGLFAEPDAIAGKAMTAMQLTEQDIAARVAAERAVASPAGTDPARANAAGADQARSEPVVPDQPARPAESQASPAGPRFTEDGKRALRDTLAVALELGCNYIGTEHLLLGLYRDPASLAARILVAAGAPEDDARTLVRQLLTGYGRTG